MSTVDAYLESFRRLAPRWPASTRDLRQQALARFADLGFPSTRLEDWKYTNVGALARTPFAPAAADGVTPAVGGAVAGARLGCATELVFVNAHHVPALSQRAALPAGVRLGSLATDLPPAPHELAAGLATCASYQAQGFTALNTAFFPDGAVVHVPPGLVLSEPIHLLFVSAAADGATVSHPRVLIVAEDGSVATVVETFIGTDTGSYWTNAVTEIIVGPGAAVSHYRLQREHPGAFHIATVAARQAADSRFESHVVSLGGALVRADVNTVLDGEGASCTLNGLYLAAQRQHVDHHTCIDHRVPRCTSRELYKGVLDDAATGVFNGKVFVRPHAQGSDAGQVNRNLLLSDAAVIDTKPQLEIFADDVRCSHGATIGRLDEDAVFYLRARGIGAPEARHLLIYAFANELIGRMQIEPVRRQLEQMLWARFRDRIGVEEAQ